VGEHLYFYARLKGVVAADERIAVERALKSVSLQSFENRLTKGLSGGERRRLSIAISLLGDPKVVFLDEPTVISINFRQG
jgi:ABC-type multidrug transport system ATPase subunit